MGRISVTPADQELARLDITLAERLGEDVDPRVRRIAEADLTLTREDDEDRSPKQAP